MDTASHKTRLEQLRETAGFAVMRHVRMSPRKMRIIANMIRGKSVDEALAILTNMPKKSARIVQKLVRSAVANADDKSQGKVDVDGLTIATVQVDHGPIVKRWLPRAMGRAARVNRRTSHITVAVHEG